MLSDFLKKVKPKEYSIQVLSDTTSKAAAKRVKHNRFSSFVKTAVSLGVVVAAIGGGAVSAGAATAVTSSNAKADILTDLFCVNGNSDDAGKWDADSNRFANMGGSTAFTMNKITASTQASDVAVFGFPQKNWGANDRYVTAYEKYGLEFPKFDAWQPVFADEEYTFKGVSAAGNGTYSDGGTIPTSPLTTAVAVQPGESKLTTTNVLSCTAILPSVEAGIANILTTPSRFITAIALELYGASFGTSISQEGSLLYPIGQAIDAMITNQGGLRDTLFVPFMIPLITIGAIWVAYIGIVKRRAAAAVQSVVWMVAAIAAGTVFLAQPTLISGFIDSGVAEIQQVINETVLTTENDMCQLNGTADVNSVTREMKCSIWYSTIYSPWVSGQFGTSITSKESADPNRDGGDVLTSDPRGFLKTQAAKIAYGSSNSVAPATWAQFMVDRQATTKTFENSEVAYAQLSGQAAMGVNGTWAGGGGNQISASILMFFGVLASTLVLFVYGFALLIYQLMMVTAVLLSPLFFLLGIVPGWGRRVLMRYAEILVSLALKRIITSLLLAIYLIFYQLVSGTGPLFVQLILVAVLAIFAVFARTRFVNMFAGDINFGGNKNISLPGATALAGAAGVGGAVAGLAVAGPLGALVGGAAARKGARQDAEGIAGSTKNMSLTDSGSAPTADVRTPRGKGPNGTPPASSSSPSAAQKAGRVAGKGLKAAESVAGVAALVPGVGTATALAVGTAAGVAGRVVTAASGADGVGAATKAAAGVGVGVAAGVAKGKMSKANDARDAAKASAKAKAAAAVVNTQAPQQSSAEQPATAQQNNAQQPAPAQQSGPNAAGVRNTQGDVNSGKQTPKAAAAVVNTQTPQQNGSVDGQGASTTQNPNSGQNTSQNGSQRATTPNAGAAVINTQKPQHNDSQNNQGASTTQNSGQNTSSQRAATPPAAAAVVNTQKPQQNGSVNGQGASTTQNPNSGQNTSQNGSQRATTPSNGPAVASTQNPAATSSSNRGVGQPSAPTRPGTQTPNNNQSVSQNPFASNSQQTRPAAAVVNTQSANNQSENTAAGQKSQQVGGAAKSTPPGQQVVNHEPAKPSGSATTQQRPAAAAVSTQKTVTPNTAGGYPGNKQQSTPGATTRPNIEQNTHSSQPTASEGTPVSRPTAPAPAPRSNQTTPPPAASQSPSASASSASRPVVSQPSNSSATPTTRPAAPTQPASAPKQQFPGGKPQQEKPKPINNPAPTTNSTPNAPSAAREVGPGKATIPVNRDKKDDEK
jgi:hypothetical protein